MANMFQCLTLILWCTLILLSVAPSLDPPILTKKVGIQVENRRNDKGMRRKNAGIIKTVGDTKIYKVVKDAKSSRTPRKMHGIELNVKPVLDIELNVNDYITPHFSELDSRIEFVGAIILSPWESVSKGYHPKTSALSDKQVEQKLQNWLGNVHIINAKGHEPKIEIYPYIYVFDKNHELKGWIENQKVQNSLQEWRNKKKVKTWIKKQKQKYEKSEINNGYPPVDPPYPIRRVRINVKVNKMGNKAIIKNYATNHEYMYTHIYKVCDKHDDITAILHVPEKYRTKNRPDIYQGDEVDSLSLDVNDYITVLFSSGGWKLTFVGGMLGSPWKAYKSTGGKPYGGNVAFQSLGDPSMYSYPNTKKVQQQFQDWLGHAQIKNLKRARYADKIKLYKYVYVFNGNNKLKGWIEDPGLYAPLKKWANSPKVEAWKEKQRQKQRQKEKEFRDYVRKVQKQMAHENYDNNYYIEPNVNNEWNLMLEQNLYDIFMDEMNEEQKLRDLMKEKYFIESLRKHNT